MSALRKLQSEIDKTLKKLDEGIGVFEDLWDKVRVALVTRKEIAFKRRMRLH